MIDGLLAITLALVFAGWVWYLKQQVAQLEHQSAMAEGPALHSHAGAGGHTPRHDLPDHEIRTAPPRRPAAGRRRTAHMTCKREGGVPTWTIELDGTYGG